MSSLLRIVTGPVSPGRFPIILRRIAVATVFLAITAHAQRQMEHLGRGVVAVRSTSTQVYVGWRLLATDPDNVGFKLYRVSGGATNTLNGGNSITATTDYVDAPPNLSVANSYFVRAVVGGVEQPASAAFTLPANAPTRQYLSVPLHTVTGGASPPYDVKFCWVGDLDGDGEYDFVVDRLTVTGTNRLNQYLQAYKRDGTFLWQMDMGYNSTNQYSIEPGSSAISIGMGDCVTVYDLDGDGKAEVIVRTARGVTVTNAAGAQMASITAANDVTQFISVFDGLTGAEVARATLPNPYSSQGPMSGHMGIMYCDGVHPNVVYEGWNRNDSTGGDMHFNLVLTTWNYAPGQLTQRWIWDRGYGPYSDFHQIRIADVDHDGKDELCEGAYVIDDNGQPLFTTELVHGDRFHVSDIDPDRPGLETFAIQQDNPSMLGMALYESGTGRMIKKWYQTGVGDVGRGIAIDIDPNYRGLEMYSTMGGIYDCKGDLTTSATLWAPEGVWWDADLTREFEDGAGSGGYNPVINKYNPVTHVADRMFSIYSDGGSYVVHQAFGARAAFWGDILGDWREELVLVASDFSEIRIYTTKIAATNRLVCLMQNPEYRCEATTKGYYEANYPDFYLGAGMPVPVPPPISDADLVWRGDGTGIWDAGATANWRTNLFWPAGSTPTTFVDGETVLFDISASNNTEVTLSGTLMPGAVTVYAPQDFVFGGSGALSGAMRLTKAGRGSLTFSATNDYSGPTLVAEGPLVVNGSLPASPVTVRGGVWHDGRIAGSGLVGGGVRIEIAGGISPGNGTNSAGTLTISNDVYEAGGAVNYFDLSDDASGLVRTNDRVDIAGDLTLSGTNTFAVHLLNTNLPPGLYTLFTYSGSFTGALANQRIVGLDGIPVALTNPPGRIALLVQAVRAPTTLRWNGGLNGNAWDLLTTSNWLNGPSLDRFNPGDSVRFDATGAANSTVTLSGLLNFGSLVVDATSNYTLTGGGVLMGGGGLTKSNSGTLTITGADHTYTGPTIVAGGTLSLTSLGIAGAPSSIGAGGVSPTNLVFSGGTLQLTGDDAYTDRGVTLGSGTNTIDIPAASVQMTLVNQVVGAGRLAKTGAGLLVFTTNNTFSGGTVIKAGRILLGGALANSSGLGGGTVTLEGGTLSMSDVQASETAAWNLVVPASAVARLDTDGRCTLAGSLTGSGILSVFVPYVRTDFAGNWSSFGGQINLVTDSDGGDFRCRNSAGYPGARINLAALTSLQNRVAGTPTIPIGELSGAARSWLSAPGGNGGLAVTWSVGGLNTSATFAGNTANAVGLIKTGSGTWTLTGTNSHSGPTTVNDGTLLINGNAAGASGAVTVNSFGTLGGVGIIGGATTVNGRLSPGSAGLGTLTFNANLTLDGGSSTLIEIRKTPLGNDRVVVNGTLNAGGLLIVTNLAGTLAAGDSFTVFDAAVRGTPFTAWSLPPLANGLAWATADLNVSGTISVVSVTSPVIEWVGVANGSLVMRGTGGVAGMRYRVLSSTNLSLPIDTWPAVATNYVEPTGEFSVTNAIDPSVSSRFYLIQIP